MWKDIFIGHIISVRSSGNLSIVEVAWNLSKYHYRLEDITEANNLPGLCQSLFAYKISCWRLDLCQTAVLFPHLPKQHNPPPLLFSRGWTVSQFPTCNRSCFARQICYPFKSVQIQKTQFTKAKYINQILLCLLVVGLLATTPAQLLTIQHPPHPSPYPFRKQSCLLSNVT